MIDDLISQYVALAKAPKLNISPPLIKCKHVWNKKTFDWALKKA